MAGDYEYWLDYWLPIMYKQHGLKGDIDKSRQFLMAVKDKVVWTANTSFYAITIVYADIYGDMTMSVLTFGTDERMQSFKKVQEWIKSVAKANNVLYIMQGSHTSDKFNRWLIKQGYKANCFKREV